MARLLADKVAILDPEFGFDAFALQADWTEELGAAQESLVEEPSGTRVLMPSACGSPLWEIHARISWRGAIPPNWTTGSLALRLACDLD